MTAIVLLALLIPGRAGDPWGWPVLSGTARVVGRVPWLKAWLQRKESVILSAEEQLLRFHTRAPRAFWMSVFLNFVAHGLAIAEVYLILLLMGSKVYIVGALMLESLTKLINAIGGLIPGTVGAYEGGNMAIVKLVRLSAGEGLDTRIVPPLPRHLLGHRRRNLPAVFLALQTNDSEARESRK